MLERNCNAKISTAFTLFHLGIVSFPFVADENIILEVEYIILILL